MKFEAITLKDFLDYELEDLNYNGKIYCYSECNEDVIYNKLKEFNLGKEHRFNTVLEENLFYIENCDIQDLGIPSWCCTLYDYLQDYVFVIIEEG